MTAIDCHRLPYICIYSVWESDPDSVCHTSEAGCQLAMRPPLQRPHGLQVHTASGSIMPSSDGTADTDNTAVYACAAGSLFARRTSPANFAELLSLADGQTIRLEAGQPPLVLGRANLEHLVSSDAAVLVSRCIYLVFQKPCVLRVPSHE